MQIKSAVFVVSNKSVDQCPKANLPEYAFTGRSNVGKSSLINMITDKKKLAKTSSTPGKTQLINHFLINESWYLADLPGYGYAKTSKQTSSGWGKMISDYIFNRINLLYTFVLIDSRLEPQIIDLEFIDWLGSNEIPFVIVFTKTDKLTKNELSKNIKHYNKTLEQTWDELPLMITSSALTKKGKEEIIEFIEKVNKAFSPKDFI